MAAFQEWDAIMLYGYSQDGLKNGKASSWSSYTHPAVMGVIPAMALLYREGHLASAKTTVVFALVKGKLFESELSPKNSIAMHITLEQHRMVVSMPETKILSWLFLSKIDKDVTIIHDLNKSILPDKKYFIVSDAGEMKRDWRKGILAINTPKSQLVMGRVGGQTTKLNDIMVKAKTSEAAIIFTSLDNKSILTSKQILVSAVAKVRYQGRASYISEPVKAEITFSSVHKGLRLVTLRPDGRESQSLLLKSNKNGEYSFVLSEKDNTHWYFITQ